MKSYRGRLDIIADILHVASHDAKKTQIMYQANLSYKVLQKYLTEIIEAGLIKFQSENKCFTLTSKGYMFLENYKEYSRVSRHVEEQLDEIHNKKKSLEELCINNK